MMNGTRILDAERSFGENGIKYMGEIKISSLLKGGSSLMKEE